jgi:hypothetical protein
MLLRTPRGCERTEGHFRALPTGAGFDLKRIVPTASPLSIMGGPSSAMTRGLRPYNLREQPTGALQLATPASAWRFSRSVTALPPCSAIAVLGHLRASVALHYAHYNLVKIPRTLRMTPAMAAGLTDRLWSVAELLEAVESEEGIAA